MVIGNHATTAVGVAAEVREEEEVWRRDVPGET